MRRIGLVRLLSRLLLLAVCAVGEGAGFSQQADPRGADLYRGRRFRRHHAAAGAEDGRGARAEADHRGQARRCRQYRRDRSREIAAGRLHAGGDRDQQFRHQSVHDENADRSADRARAGGEARGCAAGAVFQSDDPGEEFRRVHGLCEGQSRQGQFRLAGARHRQSHAAGAREADARARHAAHSLSRFAAGR